MTLTDEQLEFVLRRLALLADPVRARLVLMLEQHEMCVQGLADAIGTTPQNISYHLAIMHRDGVVSRRKDGTTVFYALADYTTCRLLTHAVASAQAHAEEIGELFTTV